jgi:hypothetical protein
VEGDDRVYLIRRGLEHADVPAPRTTADEAHLDAKARELFTGRKTESKASVPAHDIDELLVVSSWFRAHPAEMEHTRRWS